MFIKLHFHMQIVLSRVLKIDAYKVAFADRCMHNGRRYKLSDVIRDNCNNWLVIASVIANVGDELIC